MIATMKNTKTGREIMIWTTDRPDAFIPYTIIEIRSRNANGNSRRVFKAELFKGAVELVREKAQYYLAKGFDFTTIIEDYDQAIYSRFDNWYNK
jgi:hypothetical protein